MLKNLRRFNPSSQVYSTLNGRMNMIDEPILSAGHPVLMDLPFAKPTRSEDRLHLFRPCPICRSAFLMPRPEGWERLLDGQACVGF